MIEHARNQQPEFARDHEPELARAQQPEHARDQQPGRDRTDDFEVHLRMLTAEDARWMVALDQTSAAIVRTFGWLEGKLAAELDEGIWASDERTGWAVVCNGNPAGFALARRLTTGEGELEIRLSEDVRGQGVGREVLRQLADHHFATDPSLRRLEGRAHEHNVPMQRAFNAAGFRLEARYRDAFQQRDGRIASEWGYALTRSDWEAGRHRADDHGYDLHGLTFVLEEVEGPSQMGAGALLKSLQEGRRVITRYEQDGLHDGESAGILRGDMVTYRFIHELDSGDTVVGGGGARVQRRGDGRLELIDHWSRDYGPSGRHVWVERR